MKYLMTLLKLKEDFISGKQAIKILYTLCYMYIVAVLYSCTPSLHQGNQDLTPAFPQSQSLVSSFGFL